MMPPTTTGTPSRPAVFMRATTSFTSGTCEPERIDSPTTCARGLDDFRRRQADAFVDHSHAGVARTHRDLLGAVGMAVEAGLAEHEFQPAAKLARHAVDVGAQVVEAHRLVARRAPDAGGRAV